MGYWALVWLGLLCTAKIQNKIATIPTGTKAMVLGDPTTHRTDKSWCTYTKLIKKTTQKSLTGVTDPKEWSEMRRRRMGAAGQVAGKRPCSPMAILYPPYLWDSIGQVLGIPLMFPHMPCLPYPNGVKFSTTYLFLCQVHFNPKNFIISVLFRNFQLIGLPSLNIKKVEEKLN